MIRTTVGVPLVLGGLALLGGLEGGAGAEIGAVTGLTGGLTGGVTRGSGSSDGSSLGVPATSGAAAGYVADRVCATCHRDLFESYKDVGMSRSFYRPRADRMIEKFDAKPFFHEPSERYYEMSFEDDRLAITRYQLDDSGNRIHVLDQEIDWILGSGSRARSYIYQTEAGELFLAPVSWYSQSGSWQMAPGYDQPDHKGFGRAVSRDCMFCHNAFPDVPEASDLHGEPPVFPADLPEGVGCQRCHGPGGEHSALALEVAPIETVRRAILNPAHLAPDLRNDVCMQCHLQPSVAISPIRRFDRSDYSFRPGEPLADYLIHLDPVEDRPTVERFEINHHPYRLRQSRCFKKSRGRLGCLNCHDPHRKVRAAEAQSHYRAACLECHEIGACGLDPMHADGVEPDNCITCHMQPRRTQDVVHAAMTDHLIRRSPESEPARLGPIPESDPVLLDVRLLDPGDSTDAREEEVYRAVAMVRAGSVSAIGRLEAALRRSATRSTTPYFDLVTAQLRLARFRDALDTLAVLTEREPDNPTVHLHLGVAHAGSGDAERALAHFERAFELAPERPEVRYNLGKHLAVTGSTARAIEHLEAAIRLRPNLTGAWFDLGTLFANLGRFDEASRHLSQALVLNPRHERARTYLDRIAAARRSTPAPDQGSSRVRAGRPDR